MNNYASGRNRAEMCPCGRDNYDGKFANFEGHEDKGYCHSCSKYFPIEGDTTDYKTIPWVNPYNNCKIINSSEVNFGPSALTSYFNKVGIGYDANLGCNGRATVFWHKDTAGEFINAKMVSYDPVTGKRDKSMSPFYAYKKSDGYGQCFFGLEHYKPFSKIVILESEKSTIIAKHFQPNILWLASGGASGITKAKAEILRNCNVTIIPDCDEAGRNGALKGKRNLEYFDCNVEIKDINKKRTDGFDIGDWFIERMLNGRL